MVIQPYVHGHDRQERKRHPYDYGLDTLAQKPYNAANADDAKRRVDTQQQVNQEVGGQGHS